MGISNKSKHVGNHGGAYTDESGMSRQFTYVDHDIKTKIAATQISPQCVRWEELYDLIEWDDPKVIAYCNHEWGTSYKKLTDAILAEYLPLYLLEKLEKLTR